MNLFQLRAFDAVAREGSFTRAAARLFISQPAVTGHIKALEEHYQIPLLRRTARRVELTEEGARLAAITRAIFGLVDEAQALLEANRQLLSGRLEVAADGPHLVMPMIASLPDKGRADVIAVDMRNHGASGWTDSHSYPDMAADLAEVITAQPLPQSVMVGGSVSFEVAATGTTPLTPAVVV